MNIQLHDDWKTIILRAWSVRFMALSALLSGVGTALTIAQPYLGLNPLVLASIIGVVVTVAALLGIYARIVKQTGFD